MKKPGDSEEIARLTGSSMHNPQWALLEMFGMRELYGGATILVGKPEVESFIKGLSRRSKGRCERCGLNGSLRIFIKKPKGNLKPWEYLAEEVIVTCPKCYRELSAKK